MLPARHRLRDSAVFRTAVRRGRRRAGRLLVLHLLDGPGTDAPQVGLVVSRAVGNAVARNTVKRRLRHQLRDRVGDLRSGSVLVVRALPPASAASSAELAAELDHGLGRLTERAGGAAVTRTKTVLM